MEFDDAVLVDLVRQFPYLYDKGSKNYKDRNIKNNAWDTISSTLNIDTNTAQARWKVLRERYCVERRKEKNMPSGSGAKKTWPLMSAMCFLEKHIIMRKTIGNISTPLQSSQPLRSTSPWNSVDMIMDDSEETREYSFSQDLVTESAEFLESFSEVPEETEKENIVPESIPILQQMITAAKNETPPLKKKRKRNEESDIMTKLGKAFDNLSSYMETKSTSKSSNRNFEHESTINFLKSMGNDLLQINNKKIRFEAEMAIMKIVKKAVCDDIAE